MFAQGTQTQVKHDMYLARLYQCAFLLTSRDTIVPTSLYSKC